MIQLYTSFGRILKTFVGSWEPATFELFCFLCRPSSQGVFVRRGGSCQPRDTGLSTTRVDLITGLGLNVCVTPLGTGVDDFRLSDVVEGSNLDVSDLWRCQCC